MLFYIFDSSFFSYITVRAFLAFAFGFGICMFTYPKFILWAKNKGASQPIYELAPQTHKSKSETPTMGGLVFILSSITAAVLFTRINAFSISCILCLALFCAIGLIDDIKKIKKAQNQAGLKARWKLVFQTLSALICLGVLYFSNSLGSEFYLPFYKKPLFELGSFALAFWILVLVASSNAINLSDGLDGLVALPSVFSLFTLSVFIYLGSNAIFAQYLYLPLIPGSAECLIIACALIGSLLGFLWHNCHPASVFMGDSGSLPLGAFIGLLAVVSKNEVLLLLIAFIFVVETVSVIIQVASFKLLGKRVFKMTPIHHHFEKLLWSESKIIVRFWLIALLSNILALITIKIR